jgi:hypothetical protein
MLRTVSLLPCASNDSWRSDIPEASTSSSRRCLNFMAESGAVGLFISPALPGTGLNHCRNRCFIGFPPY